MQGFDTKTIARLCDELLKAVEELLLGGLTAASKSTIERIDVSFKEAARMKLLRLGSNLRITNEEISRFHANSPQFSAKRFTFFLSRTWLLAHGISRAIQAGDQAAFQKLMFTPATEPVKQVAAVLMGIGKRVVPGAFAAFELRLRVIEDAAPLTSGESLVWSFVFPMRKDLDLPAEAFLHLPQKQKYRPSMLLEKKVITITNAAVSRQPDSAARLVLADASEVTTADLFTDWQSLWTWERARSYEKLQQHRPTPLDLEIELQDEVVLHDWNPGPRSESEEGYDNLPMESDGLTLVARLDRGLSGDPLHGLVTKMAGKKKRPPLFGTMHYESCRMVFQPLSALGDAGPDYLTLSPDKISQAELVKAMKFT